jgi:hypothetical protein
MGRADVPPKYELGLSVQGISTRGPSGALANAQGARRESGAPPPHRPEALDGVPGHSEGAGVLYVNVRFQHLAVLDQMVALDDVKLFRMRRAKPVHP